MLSRGITKPIPGSIGKPGGGPTQFRGDERGVGGEKSAEKRAKTGHF
jgi:hypothetical protein